MARDMTWDLIAYNAVAAPWLASFYHAAGRKVPAINSRRQSVGLPLISRDDLVQATFDLLHHPNPKQTVWGVAPAPPGKYVTVIPKLQIPESEIRPWDTWITEPIQGLRGKHFDIPPGKADFHLVGYHTESPPSGAEQVALVSLARAELTRHRFRPAMAALEEAAEILSGGGTLLDPTKKRGTIRVTAYLEEPSAASPENSTTAPAHQTSTKLNPRTMKASAATIKEASTRRTALIVAGVAAVVAAGVYIVGKK